jgi:hypothetical protein
MRCDATFPGSSWEIKKGTTHGNGSGIPPIQFLLRVVTLLLLLILFFFSFAGSLYTGDEFHSCTGLSIRDAPPLPISLSVLLGKALYLYSVRAHVMEGLRVFIYDRYASVYLFCRLLVFAARPSLPVLHGD